MSRLRRSSGLTSHSIDTPLARIGPAHLSISLRMKAPRYSGVRCGAGATVLQVKAGSPPAMTTVWCGAVRGRGSAMVTTTDGHSNPVVWMLGAEGDNRLHGYKGDTGEELFTSEPLSGLRRFQTLIATQGRLYVGADGRVYAFMF